MGLSTPTLNEVREGEIIAGKFRVERVLGQGGMGVVVAATHIQLEERVALKFLLPEALNNPEAVARFVREARAAVKIKSEHVARVSDVGTLPGGSPYIVMEYLEGQDLSNWVQTSGPMPVLDAVQFILQAGEAVAEAHALGIVHRDLKPSNLFVTRRADGSICVKVLDFGISKLTLGGSSNASMTRTDSVMGSPYYMSPEQMSSTRSVDARTDIWALGVIMYEVLSGETPFQADTMPQLCGMILQEQPRPLRDLRPDVGDALQAIVLRCLEKDRERRFANVAELAAALAPFGAVGSQQSAERIARVLGASSMKAPGGAPFGVPGLDARTQTSVNWGASQASRKSRGAWLFVVPLLLVALGAAAFFALRGTATTEPTAAPGTHDARAAAPPSAAPLEAPAPTVVEMPPPEAPAALPSLQPASEPSGGDDASPKPPALPAARPAARPAPPRPAPPAQPTPKAKPPEPAPPPPPRPAPAAPAFDPLDGRR